MCAGTASDGHVDHRALHNHILGMWSIAVNPSPVAGMLEDEAFSDPAFVAGISTKRLNAVPNSKARRLVVKVRRHCSC